MTTLKDVYYSTATIAGKKITVKNYQGGKEIWVTEDKAPKRPPEELFLTDWYFRHQAYTKEVRERVDGLFWSNINKHCPRTSPKFVTVTFKENVQDISKAYHEFKKFIQRFNRHAGKAFNVKNLEYLATLEFQDGTRKKDLKEKYESKGQNFYSVDHMGCIHFHMIFFNLPFIEKEKLAELWGNGFVNIQSCRAGRKGKKEGEMLSELVKYITCSDFDLRVMGQKIFTSSKGLNKPVKEHFPVWIQQPDTKSYQRVSSVLYDTEHSGRVIKHVFFCDRETKGLVLDEGFKKTIAEELQEEKFIEDRLEALQGIQDETCLKMLESIQTCQNLSGLQVDCFENKRL